MSQSDYKPLFDLVAHGDAAALLEGDLTVTYRELDELAAGIADAVGSRALVFVLCGNRVGAVAGYVGFVNRGMVPLLLDAGMDDELLQGLVERYRPQFAWVPAGSGARFPGFGTVYGRCGYELLESRCSTWHPLHPELALLVSTSGSTGTPKLVRLSYGNLDANTNSIVDYLGIRAQDRAIASLPLNYVYGLSVLQTHLRAGASIVLTEAQCYGAGFWERFESTGCTSFAGVPFMYEMLARLRFTRKEPPGSLRVMTQAGGRLAPALQDEYARFARDFGLRFFVMYGASEATARMAYVPPEYALSKPGSIGVAVPGGRFEIAGDGQDGGEVGELVYYGANVSMGYAQSVEDLALGDCNGGRLFTGDLARVDEDGFYYVVGRRKRFVKILGKRVSLDEMEDLVKSRMGLSGIACGGQDDLLCVFVADGEARPADVLDCVHAATGINAKLVRVVPVDEIPKNASGKTLYAKLDELAAGKTLYAKLDELAAGQGGK